MQLIRSVIYAFVPPSNTLEKLGPARMALAQEGAFFIMTEIPLFVQTVLFCGGVGVGLLIGILIGAQLTYSWGQQRPAMEQRVFRGTIGTIDLP